MHWKNVLNRLSSEHQESVKTIPNRLRDYYNNPEEYERERIARLAKRVQEGNFPQAIPAKEKEKHSLSPLGFDALASLAGDPKDRGKTFKRCGTL